MSRQTLICTYCQEAISLGVVTICLHLYCEECFRQVWIQQKDKKDNFNFEGNNRERRYMLCHNLNCEEKIYNKQTLQLPRINRFNKNI